MSDLSVSKFFDGVIARATQTRLSGRTASRGRTALKPRTASFASITQPVPITYERFDVLTRMSRLYPRPLECGEAKSHALIYLRKVCR